MEEASKLGLELRSNGDARSLEGRDLVHFLQGAEMVIIGREQLHLDILDQLPLLKLVSKYGVGLDNLDQAALAQKGIALHFGTGVNRRAVAEQTLGFMLDLFRNLSIASARLKEGKWIKNGGKNLTGKTIGILGLGNIGQEVVRLLNPFDCEILATDIADRSAFAIQNGVRMVSVSTLLSDCDLITLHIPLTDQTRGMVDLKFLHQMKAGSYLINTARGEIICQSQLVEVLQSGHLAGAALDVFDVEPVVDRDLLALPNFIGTPHIAGNSEEAVLAMGRSALDGVRSYLND